MALAVACLTYFVHLALWDQFALKRTRANLGTHVGLGSVAEIKYVQTEWLREDYVTHKRENQNAEKDSSV